jgi:phenylalanyl-tRNA synthetase beta chain
VHPDLQERLKLKLPVFVAEIDFDELARIVLSPVTFAPLARYPAVERDLSIVIAKDLPYGSIRAGILGLGISELVSVELMDAYEGDQIPPNKVSITLRFLFQDLERTLTVDRIQRFSDNIQTYVKTNFDAELR